MEIHRFKEITPFIVMEILEEATKMSERGIDIIHMEVGEPDFDVPSPILATNNKAALEGQTHYTHSLGDLKLRETIAQHYATSYQVSVSADQILVTGGSSPAILLALSVLINPNDEVIISNPGYACYPNFIRYLNGKIIEIPVNAQNGFQYSPKEIAKKITSKTKAIIINSPMNPTGNLLDSEVMKEIASLGPTVISDEIYHGLVYEGEAHSILEFNKEAFVVNGFSKKYAMTGMRLGYVIAPKKYVRMLQKLQQNLFICAGSIAQQCGITALKECDVEVEKMRKTYNERRNFVVSRLQSMGFKIPVVPTGAFYVFVDASHLSDNSYDLAFDILHKAHIGVTPGIDFGSNGEGFLRFSYANSIENLKEGMNRFEAYLKKYYPANRSLDF